jgi:uncharacterized protein (UPF0297 family)
MEFRKFGRSRTSSVAWKPQLLTFEELGYQVKTALSGFYVSNNHAIWPRHPNAPEEVRIVDDDGEEIVAYTVHDLIEETRRILLPLEPVESLEVVSAPKHVSSKPRLKKAKACVG